MCSEPGQALSIRPPCCARLKHRAIHATRSIKPIHRKFQFQVFGILQKFSRSFESLIDRCQHQRSVKPCSLSSPGSNKRLPSAQVACKPFAVLWPGSKRVFCVSLTSNRPGQVWLELVKLTGRPAEPSKFKVLQLLCFGLPGRGTSFNLQGWCK